MRQYELTLTFDLTADNIDEAREKAIAIAHRQFAKSWTIEGKPAGLKDHGETNEETADG
jgi:hypothetical protein